MRPTVAAPKNLTTPAKSFPMVTLKTNGGRAITMTPESLFGLKKIDGSPILLSSCNIARIKPMRFDEPQGDAFNPDDPRYWYLAGLIVSGGTFPTHKTHAACIYYPISRKWELDIISRFLSDYFDSYEKATFPGRYPKTVVSSGSYGSSLSSKMFNMIFERLGRSSSDAGRGAPIFHDSKEGRLKFLCGMSTDSAYAGFMSGILAGAKEFPEGRIFSHHNSRLVRFLSDLLFKDFGIPTELNINPHEDVVLSQRRNLPNVHSFTVHREHYLKVQDAGLAHWDEDYINRGVQGAPLGLFTDPVASIEATGIKCGYEITPASDDQDEVVHNGFLFNAEFEPNPIALDIASMKELFAEVSDRDKLVAALTPDMTFRHGAI